jgi:hypothetical protein
MSRNWLPNLHRGLIAGGFVATAPIMVACAALTVAVPAFAQSSLDSSSAPAGEYALPPPDGGSLAEPATPDDAIPDDATSSAAVPSEPSAAAKPATAADKFAPPPRRIPIESGMLTPTLDSDGQTGKVLEVPQVLPPANSQPPDDADQTAQGGGSKSPSVRARS